MTAPAGTKPAPAPAARRPPGGRTRPAVAAGRRRRVYAAAVVTVLLAVAVAGPALAPHDPAAIAGPSYAPPGPGHPLGTDALGRDVLSRLLAGGRPLVFLPAAATAAACLLGAAAGTVSGYLGGRAGTVLGAATKLLLVFPPVLVLLVAVDARGGSALALGLVVVVTGAPFVARLTHAAARRTVTAGYVELAPALGESTASVLLREVLPAVARPLLADAGARLAGAMEISATAAFLGFGPQGPNWGAMVSENLSGVTLAPWGVAAPAGALALLVVCVNLGLDRLTRGAAA
ncbi:ABC transporter permease [Actinacidiphila epipremni]|uniref:ABC transporter permease n=1 Tax=Actinacidiphila epipremni TaxID=2053013 RepID=A0ABX0ZJS0_9ACTN|nr:ABC transporter permease subunit [Actinacidiphila epipremni]NJP43551.1 ABC transporter permease [Actinacidiphila epipremni]